MKESKDIPRSQLVSMIADLRGVLYETRGYLLGRGKSRITEVLERTTFDLSESDEVEGGYDPAHRKEA